MVVVPLASGYDFIITLSITGDGHTIKAYKSDADRTAELAIDHIFPPRWFENFEPKGKSCESLASPFLLNFTLGRKKILVESWSDDECLLDEKLVFKFNNEKVKYELVK